MGSCIMPRHGAGPCEWPPNGRPMLHNCTCVCTVPVNPKRGHVPQDHGHLTDAALPRILSMVKPKPQQGTDVNSTVDKVRIFQRVNTTRHCASDVPRSNSLGRVILPACNLSMAQPASKWKGALCNWPYWEWRYDQTTMYSAAGRMRVLGAGWR
jgi:hypothetical protein